ncbi:MAG: YitT family protein [Oscillospiraceae bacterium]|nr:YitT family protein [Oscillospiraceae bacterium]
MKKKLLTVIQDYGLIFISCILYAFSFDCFFQPIALPMGGFSGIAQILHHVVPYLPVGVTIFVMNIPLMILGVKKEGWMLLAASVFAITVSSVAIDLMAMLVNFQTMDPLLACLYGGVTLGVSLGLMFLKGATTGGTELAARLLKYRFRNISVGKLCLMIDVSVICLYALTFGDVHNALYGVVAMYACSLVMDMVVYGTKSAKLAYIISDKSEAIRDSLMKLGLGATLVPAKGAYTKSGREILMCAVRPSKLSALKSVVAEIDGDNAFVIVSDAREVFGEGFGTYSEL